MSSLTNIFTEQANTTNEVKSQVELNGQPFSTFKLKNETLEPEVQAVKVIQTDITGNVTMIYGNTKYGIWGSFKWGTGPTASVITTERIVPPENIFNERFIGDMFINTTSTTATVNLTSNTCVFDHTSDILVSHVIFKNDETISDVKITSLGSDDSNFEYYINTQDNLLLPITGTITGATFTTGNVGTYALSFDGSSYVAFGNPSALQLGDTAQSFSFWIKTTNANGYIWSKNNSGAGALQLQLFNGRLYTYKGGFTQDSSTNTYNDGNWHHVVVTYSGSRIDYYKDGSANGSDTSIAGTISDTLSAYLGIRSDLDANYRYNGLLDDFRIYNKVLSSGEIATLYAKGNVTDGLVMHLSFEEGSGTTLIANGWEGVNYDELYNPANTGEDLKYCIISNTNNVNLTDIQIEINQEV